MSRASKIFGTEAESAPTIKNRDGYPAYERPIEEQYIQTLLTNTFGGTFYATQRELLDEAKAIHATMVKKDPAFVAKALVYARNHGYMRTQPIYGLVMLANASSELFEQVFDQVILTPNDLSDFVTILKSTRGNEGGRKVKRVIGKWLLNHLTEYWVIKYGAEKSGQYSLKDIVKLTHPNAKGRNLPLFAYLLGKEVNLDLLPQIKWFEALKKAETDEERVRAIVEGKLPHEVATAVITPTKAVWEAIAQNLPIMALLKNLATLERHGVADSNRALIEGKFNNEEILKRSKILPYRFLEAMKHVNAPWISDALRDAVDKTFANLPDITGKTVIALDHSGSMGSYMQTAAIFGVSLMKKANLDGKLYQFDTLLDEVKVSMRDSILTQADRIRARGGTDTGLPMRQLIADKYFADNIILITDEQQNTGSTFVSELDTYRKKVNKNVKVFIVDLAPYRSALTPKGKENVWYIYGWSDQVLNFISFATQGWDNIVDYIKAN